MGERSKIEWTDSTFNPWVGCTKVRRRRTAPSACDFCYAEKWARRSGQVEWGNHPRRRTTEAYWRNPVAWNDQAPSFQIKHRRRQRVFCASLADVFDNQVDRQWRSDLFNLIRACNQLDWQLLKTPAAIHFVSYEPALGPLGQLDIDGLYPDWIIIGGESGVRSDLTRRTDPRWARDAITECRRLGVAPFLKQWGTYANNPYVVEAGYSVPEVMKIDPPENGKGGGKLDDRLCREFPVTTSKLESMMITRGRTAENGSEGRPLFVG